jgi:hypothetical protein
MELCVIKFDGDTFAEASLEAALVTRPDIPDWVADVSVVSRSRSGTLTVASAGRLEPSRRFRYHEGELAAVASELDVYSRALLRELDAVALDIARVGVLLAGDVERRFFHTTTLKELLTCDSSALLLFAHAAVCDDVERTFSGFTHELIRRGLDDELTRRFASFENEAEGDARYARIPFFH